MSVPLVEITQMLRQALVADGYPVSNYLQEFQDWKTDWDKQEFRFWFFGKDGANKFPLRNGNRVLRHVHLPPEINPAQKKYWDAQFDRKGNKKSNTALIYAGDEKLNRYLLIYVVVEPRGHDVQEMRTVGDAALMNSFADQAAEYLDTGNVYL